MFCCDAPLFISPVLFNMDAFWGLILINITTQKNKKQNPITFSYNEFKGGCCRHDYENTQTNAEGVRFVRWTIFKTEHLVQITNQVNQSNPQGIDAQSNRWSKCYIPFSYHQHTELYEVIHRTLCNIKSYKKLQIKVILVPDHDDPAVWVGPYEQHNDSCA